MHAAADPSALLASAAAAASAISPGAVAATPCASEPLRCGAASFSCCGSAPASAGEPLSARAPVPAASSRHLRRIASSVRPPSFPLALIVLHAVPQALT